MLRRANPKGPFSHRISSCSRPIKFYKLRLDRTPHRRVGTSFCAHRSSFTNAMFRRFLHSTTPILGINTQSDISMKRRIRPIGDPFYQPVFYRIEMNNPYRPGIRPHPESDAPRIVAAKSSSPGVFSLNHSSDFFN